jgi:outer membrane protein
MVRFFSTAVLTAVVAVATAGSMAAAAQAPAPKFAFVDSRSILQRAPGSAAIQAQISKEREAAQASVSKMQDSLRTMYDLYLKEQPSLTPAQRDQREKALQTKNAEFDQRVSQMDQQMQQRQFELIQPMMNQIREVLDNIRNEESYLFIFDIGNDPGLIVAADKNLDITERVLARLKPVAVNLSPSDSTKAPAAARPGPAGIRPPTKPPTR